MFKRSYKRVPRPRRFNNQVHSFKQSTELSNISVAAATTQQFAYTFDLNQLTNVASFNTLFDEYRINAVKVSFTPAYNFYGTAVTAGTVSMPVIYTVTDYDSDASLAAGALDQYTNLKYRSFNRTHTHYLKPKVLNQIFISAGSTGNNPIRAPWLDMANANVPHYGILGVITASDSSKIAAQLVRVHATFYLQCRYVR